jgi:hypothetical protein
VSRNGESSVGHLPLFDFGLLWIGALASLSAALLLMWFYFRILGSDLALNSVPKELVLAIVVSALQAGLVWFTLPYLHSAPPSSVNGQSIYLIPGLISLVLYNLAHVADWDQYESPGLVMFQFVIVSIAGNFIQGAFGLGVLVLTAFVTILCVVGAFAKQVGG